MKLMKLGLITVLLGSIAMGCSSPKKIMKLKTAENDSSTKMQLLLDAHKCKYYVQSNQSRETYERIETCLKLRGWTRTRSELGSEFRLNQALEGRKEELRNVSNDELVEELRQIKMQGMKQK